MERGRGMNHERRNGVNGPGYPHLEKGESTQFFPRRSRPGIVWPRAHGRP